MATVSSSYEGCGGAPRLPILGDTLELLNGKKMLSYQPLGAWSLGLGNSEHRGEGWGFPAGG